MGARGGNGDAQRDRELISTSVYEDQNEFVLGGGVLSFVCARSYICLSY